MIGFRIQILLEVLVLLDPAEVSAFSQSCRYAHEFCNPHPMLWKNLFLRIFDPPPIHRASAQYDFEGVLKNRIRGKNAVRRAQRQEDPLQLLSTTAVLDLFSDMARVAADENSPNARFLSDLFPVDSPFVAQFLNAANAQALSSRQLRSTVVPTREELSIAQFQTWYGPTKHSFSSANLARGIRRVYVMDNYTPATNYGTFLDDNLTVDWVSLDAVRNIVLDNIDDARQSEDWAARPNTNPLHVPGRDSWRDTIRSGAGPRVGRDWAGVSLNWVGSYCFADWQVFEMINLSSVSREVLERACLLAIARILRLALL